MSRQRRKSAVEQKLQIFQEADQECINQTIGKHNLPHGLFLRWKNQFNTGDASSLQTRSGEIDPEIRALQEGKARLKKIIGNQASSRSLKQGF